MQAVLVKHGLIILLRVVEMLLKGLGLLVAVLFFGSLVWLLATHPSYKYYRLEVGMTTQEAIAAMESAPRRAYTPEGFCTQYRDTMLFSFCDDDLMATNTVTMLIWQTRIDTVVVVGVSRDDTISFLGFGDV